MAAINPTYAYVGGGEHTVVATWASERDRIGHVRRGGISLG